MLPTLPADSVHCVVTSPPYWGLRDYGVAGQLGLESTPEAYLAQMVGVFREVRRVLRDDGTCWLNMGDAYNSRLNGSHGGWNGSSPTPQRTMNPGADVQISAPGCKPKDLVGMPWRLAFALQADGWYLRADCIWAKPNPMPESVTDRPTKAHEYVFLLTKSARYFYDADAVREPDAGNDHARSILTGQASLEPSNGLRSPHRGLRTLAGRNGTGRNLRTVWTIATEPTPDAHFATFPQALALRCILAGCPAGGIVLDPFAGTGTVGRVAEHCGRHAILIELSPAYGELIRERTAQRGLFAQGNGHAVSLE